MEPSAVGENEQGPSSSDNFNVLFDAPTDSLLMVEKLKDSTSVIESAGTIEKFAEQDFQANGSAETGYDQSSSAEVPTAKDITALPSQEHQYSMNVADYHLGAVIGFGSSAIVYMAKYLPLNTDVAVKMIELDHFERNRIDELRKEIQVMALCKHPNLLGILTSFVQESKLWIVTPFLAGGSCLDIIKCGFKSGFDEAVIATILIQALQALVYLHEHGHIHRDLKCGNLLMAEDGLVQLADFGVSSSLLDDGDRRGVRKTYVGTPCWMAPEVMEITRGYDFKADIWSFGITALELAYGHAPYAKFPPMKVIYLTLSGKPPTLDRKVASHKYSRVFKEMIDCCLQRDPVKRPTAKQLLKHPFFKSAKKPSFLQETVIASVAPVHQRDKSAQLKARGLRSSLSPAHPEGFVAAGNNPLNDNPDALDGINDDTSESWDFSIDNGNNANDVDIDPSLMNTIDEEDEDYMPPFAEKDGLGDGETHHAALSSPLSDRPITPVLSPSSQDDSSAASFPGLQKNRTSRFIVDKSQIQSMDSAESGNSVSYDNVPPTYAEEQRPGSTDQEPFAVAESIESSMAEVSSTTSNSSDTQTHAQASHPAEVKKGRFSVVESVNGDGSNPDPSPTGNTDLSVGESEAISTSKPDLMDEEKRSRFEVTTNEISQNSSADLIAGTGSSLDVGNSAVAASSAPHLPCNYYYSSSNPALQPLHYAHYHQTPHYPPAPLNQLHLSRPAHATYNPYAGYVSHYPNPMIPHPHVMHIHPQQAHITAHGYHHSSPPPPPPAAHHRPLPSLSTFSFMPASVASGPSSTLPMGHSDPIYVAPLHRADSAPVNQFEHLLQMNDYIRAQLVELQANTSAASTASSPVLSNVPPGSHSHHPAYSSISHSTEFPYSSSSPIHIGYGSECPCSQCQKAIVATDLGSLLSELEAIRRENEQLKSQIHGKKEE